MSASERLRRGRNASVFFLSILAALVYGLWAVYANIEYGRVVYIRSGIGQGIYAFFSTWLVTKTTLSTAQFFSVNRFSAVIGFVCGFAVMLVIPLLIHLILKTPDIVQTISPGLIWGSIYIAMVLRARKKVV